MVMVVNSRFGLKVMLSNSVIYDLRHEHPYVNTCFYMPVLIFTSNLVLEVRPVARFPPRFDSKNG